MSYKLSVDKNYIVVTDTVTADVEVISMMNTIYHFHADHLYFVNIFDKSLTKHYDFPTLLRADGTAWDNEEELTDWLRKYTSNISSELQVNGGTNALARDAWGRPKAIIDKSLLHGMFTFNVPADMWYETVNNVVSSTFVNSLSVDGALNFYAGATLNDDTLLRTFQCPRYQPNRGHLYSTAVIFREPDALMTRRFGTFTKDSGVFFSLESGDLYAVVRTTRNSIVYDDKRLIDTRGIDLSKGNVFDANWHWRGVGNYMFYINLQPVLTFENLGTLTELSMFNPANPAAFESINLGDNEPMIVGCIDITSENGQNESLVYGSIGVNTQSGSVSITGYNIPILVTRNKLLVNGLTNTRDITGLAASAYTDNNAIFKIWKTRDASAITLNNQTWTNYGDGHLEYIVYDTPDVATPMAFNTAKAELLFSCRVIQDQTYRAPLVFDKLTELVQSAGDIIILTMHRETGVGALVGVTYEFAENI